MTLVSSNDDLLTKILLRFKYVSKHRLSFLSNRHFTLRFDKLSVSPGLFFNNEYIPFEDVENQSTKPFHSLDFYHDPHGIRIVQLCNGLLLCCRTYGLEYTYYVFNPTTKQFAVIPPVIGGWNVRNNISCMSLAFHQTDCVHYKLVCIHLANSVSYPDSPLYKIQIYSSDTGKWRISPQSFSLSFSMCGYLSTVYCNGAIHWNHDRGWFYFKLDVEHFLELPLPDYYGGRVLSPSFASRYLGESRGHMHLVDGVDQEGLHMNVYEMLTDHSGWFLKYQVKLRELLFSYPSMSRSATDPCCEFLNFVRGEKEEDTFMVVKVHKKIIRYNILDKSFKTIFNLSGIFYYGDGGHHYIEMIGSF